MDKKPNLLRNKNLIREYQKLKTKKLFISCPKNLVKELLHVLNEYTNIIIVLEIVGQIILPADLDNIYISDENQLYYLNDIFSNEVSLFGFPVKDYTEIYYGFLIDLRKTDNYIDNLIGTELLVQYVPESFILSGIRSESEKRNYYLFSNVKKNKVETNQKKKRKAIIVFYAGFGDTIMGLPRIQKFIDTNQEKGYEVSLILYSYQPMYIIAKSLFKNCSFLCVDSLMDERAYEAILRSGIFKECYLLYVPQSLDKHYHVMDIWEKILGVHISKDCYSFETNAFKMLSLGYNKLAYVLSKNYKLKIGFQFYTDSDMKKCWPIEHVVEFVKLCEKSKIGILNLSPHPFGNISGLIDASLLSVEELIYLISELDIVVGIDSFAGHIAALLGKPNITIWGRSYPHQNRPLEKESSLISFRPLRMNYSLVSRDTNSAKISPSKVFAIVENIFNGIIKPKKSNITIEDSLHFLDVEWVGDESSVI